MEIRMKHDLIGSSVQHVMKKNIGFTILLLISVIGVVLSSLLPPQLLRIIIDQYLTKHNSDGFFRISLFYFISFIMIGVFDFLKAGILTILGQKITAEVRTKMMHKLSRIKMSYFTSNEPGAMVSRFTNDVETIQTLFSEGIISMFIDCFKIIGILISIWVFSGRLGVILGLVIVLIYWITRLFQRRMLHAQSNNRKLIGKINSHISESLKNIRMIKSYHKETYMEENYKRVLRDTFHEVEHVNFFDSLYSPIVLLIQSVLIGGILFLSSDQIHFTGISVGMVAATIDYIANLFTPIESLGMEFQSIQDAVSGIQRINEFSQEEDDEPTCEKKAEEILPDRKHFTIQIEHMSFSYTPGEPVLKNLSFSIEAEEYCTIAGRTGVGKSTLFKLLLGLLKPTQGSIAINGTDVYSISNSEKRKLFGYVEQSFHFIPGTVADQISLKDPSINRQQVLEALEFVGLSDYTAALENGCDTLITNDSLFSWGQKQLLSIARAIAANPPILLLDEITANLDSYTEDQILTVLKKASKERTIISISHRTSAAKSSDKTIYIENGSIVPAP